MYDEVYKITVKVWRMAYGTSAGTITHTFIDKLTYIVRIGWVLCQKPLLIPRIEFLPKKK